MKPKMTRKKMSNLLIRQIWGLTGIKCKKHSWMYPLDSTKRVCFICGEVQTKHYSKYSLPGSRFNEGGETVKCLKCGEPTEKDMPGDICHECYLEDVICD